MTLTGTPADAEITLNLWYIYDDDNLIYRLLVRAYLDTGSDEAKRTRLFELAKTDYWIAKQFALPKQFHVKLVSPDSEKTLPVLPVQEYNSLPPLLVFEDAIKTVQAELPGFCPLSVPQDPMVCVTPLKMDDAGRLQPEFGKQRLF